MTKLEKYCSDILPFYALLLLFLGAGGIFLLRAPALVVTDDLFSAVYGVSREHFRRIETSLRLFRMVRLVRIADGAELDAVVIAVQDASPRPFCAVFPYRYSEAARRYAEENGATPVVLIAGRNTPLDEGGRLVVKTDQVSDSYRAALCAALFSKNDSFKTVLVINEKNMNEETNVAFEEGMAAGGSGAKLVFRARNDSYSFSDVVCAVLWGPANSFLDSSTREVIPTIIFSWIDHTYTSNNTKVVIDDSPLQLLPQIVKSLNKKATKDALRSGESVTMLAKSRFKVLNFKVGSAKLAFLLNFALLKDIS
jgi:hypothetical protein